LPVSTTVALAALPALVLKLAGSAQACAGASIGSAITEAALPTALRAIAAVRFDANSARTDVNALR
jgi:hypothetical protein